MKNKTIATWLTFLGGPLGLHRFYLRGFGDWLGWLHPIPTVIGLYGIHRARTFGLDDQLSWVLIPIGGFAFAATALTAIVYGLSSPERWAAWFNPESPQGDAAATRPANTSNWFTVVGVALALMVGMTVLVSSLVVSIQRYFEYQVEEARKISQ